MAAGGDGHFSDSLSGKVDVNPPITHIAPVLIRWVYIPPTHDKGSARFQTGVRSNRRETALFAHRCEMKNAASHTHYLIKTASY